MKHVIGGLLPLMFCSVALTSCTDTLRVAEAVVPPADRMDCEAVDRADRPDIPPEYVIDWSGVTTVEGARGEHEAFVTRLRERESITAVYIVEIEGRLFACANDDAWLRDFFAGIE